MNYIPEGGVFFLAELSRRDLMIGHYLRKRQYELGTCLGKYGDEILMPVKTRHNFQS